MLTIGVLGAARITDNALLKPAAEVDGVEVTAVAARSRGRAQEWAAKHGIPTVHDSYEALLADPAIDAVYIPLPNGLHGRWTLAALEAGKHVLCEKPFTANADEAREVAAAAASSPLVVMEAHHTSHHPQTKRAAEIVASGMLGDLVSAEASFIVPMPPSDDIRWNPDLAGGSLMDLGCYPLRWLRDVLGSVPTVVSAVASDRDGIDASMDARLDYDGVPARVRAAMWTTPPLLIGAKVVGSAATMKVRIPYAPQTGGKISVTGEGVRLREKASSKASYTFQLEAFRDAVIAGGPVLTDAAAAVETMQTIDDVYRAAGMQPRRVS
ncbi:Gfo/Idh/MocA family protein [Salinibacterium soli]|uniref:Gfo/Idh/MocA family oxidoreductase n=1 Tax=Antiquaquibacter soli TaxID=3064523 RepID=A0ABT9BNF4_9MICO|nr:Gfo/Idh/MocA family oxidoreductase [Protaetiibacter sp. WY-16]MDO7882572.1 Gfo/Idh/MocA family oxidoreductase [Protaetiibacter sp. WY-16]